MDWGPPWNCLGFVGTCCANMEMRKLLRTSVRFSKSNQNCLAEGSTNEPTKSGQPCVSYPRAALAFLLDRGEAVTMQSTTRSGFPYSVISRSFCAGLIRPFPILRGLCTGELTLPRNSIPRPRGNTAS